MGEDKVSSRVWLLPRYEDISACPRLCPLRFWDFSLSTTPQGFPSVLTGPCTPWWASRELHLAGPVVGGCCNDLEFLGSPSLGTLPRALHAFSLPLPSSPTSWATLASFYMRKPRMTEVKYLNPAWADDRTQALNPDAGQQKTRPLSMQTLAERPLRATHHARFSRSLHTYVSNDISHDC